MQPHPNWEERPVCILERADNADNGANITDVVRNHCRKSFPSFQVPDDVVVWQELPTTSVGKIDKQKVRDTLKSQGYTLPSLRVASRL